MAEVILPPTETGPIQIEGEFRGQGVSCMQLRLPTGEAISLKGMDLKAVTIGTKLRLTGKFVMFSNCMEGRTFIATSVELPPT